MPVSSAHIGCCTDYTVAGKCTIDGNNNKEDKTREEADMNPSPVFPKSSKVVQKCPRVVQIHISSVFDRYPSFGSILDRFGHFWKKRVMSASSLVLSSLLSLLSTVHPILPYICCVNQTYYFKGTLLFSE